MKGRRLIYTGGANSEALDLVDRFLQGTYQNSPELSPKIRIILEDISAGEKEEIGTPQIRGLLYDVVMDIVKRFDEKEMKPRGMSGHMRANFRRSLKTFLLDEFANNHELYRTFSKIIE